MTNYLHKGDLPAEIKFIGSIAIDTEAMGLNNFRDKLCLVQLSDGKGDVHLVQPDRTSYNAPNLKKLLGDKNVEKIFHFARFDVAILHHYLGVWTAPIYCTKIASRLVRTYTDSHGLKDLCQELLNKKISKQQQSSDWGADHLSKDQIEYAASDVIHLHELKDSLNLMLAREGRTELAKKCFEFLPVRAELDLSGWAEEDIFSHSTKRGG